MTITSVQNLKIKQLRKLQSSSQLRKETGTFVVEGVRLLEETLQSGWHIQQVFYTDELSDRGNNLLLSVSKAAIEHEEVAPHIMKSISDTRSPQGICAIVQRKYQQTPDSPDLILILDGISDPGNLGTILRTAAAAGVQAVYLSPGSTDPFSPKVVRGGTGAQFRIPVLDFFWEDLQLITAGMNCFAADVSQGTEYLYADFSGRTAILIGSEAHGLSIQSSGITQQKIRINMPGGAESLNAAVSAGIILFEILRQRRQ